MGTPAWRRKYSKTKSRSKPWWQSSGKVKRKGFRLFGFRF